MRRVHMLTSSTPEGDILLRRAATASSASAVSTSSASGAESTTCPPNSTSDFCQKPVGAPTLPIVLGIAIPVFVALVVLVILHRRHILRLKKEDIVAAKIDLNHDDFDMTPPRYAPRGRREQTYGTDYLLPMGNFGFAQSNVSLNSPYDVIPKEASRMHEIQRSNVPPRAPESAMLRTTSYNLYGPQNSPYDFQNQAKDGNASAGTRTPSILTSVTSYATRTLPKLPIHRSGTVKESFEMQEISNQQSVLVQSPSSDVSSSDPIVAAVVNGFQALRDDEPSSSDLSSSPPGRSLSPPESLQSSSPPQFPRRSDSMKRLSRYPRPSSTAPPVPSRDSKIPLEDRVSYYEDPSGSDSGTDDEPDSSSVEGNYHEVLEPATLQSPAKSAEATDTKPAVQTSHLAPSHDNLSHEANYIRRQRSFSSPADAEERANRLRSFYKDYFDNPMPVRDDPALPVLTQDDSAVAYEFTGRAPTTAVSATNLGTSAAGHFVRPEIRHPMRVPRSMSSQSGRPFQGHAQYRHESQAYPAYNNANYTPVYQPQYHPYRPPQQLQRPPPKQLPPLEPLSPLPTPHQLEEQSIHGSPTLFAPPRRPRAGTAGSSAGSSSGSPSTPQQQWVGMQLRTLPNPYMLRNSASYSGLEFLPAKKYSPGGVVSVSSNMDNAYQYGYNQHMVGDRLSRQLPRELVPVARDDVEDKLRPQWHMR
ncbi:hypothetical protein V1525DRAFT_404535 [Lipomyces kononenkoae]|uniref:Uncharacterized protein n=1 Tax=Lipomyces kononenkoae TaxID=34357 RepID=A0ACC3T1D0_LIPKO